MEGASQNQNPSDCCNHVAIVSGGGGCGGNADNGAFNDASHPPLPFLFHFYTNLTGTTKLPIKTIAPKKLFSMWRSNDESRS